MYCFRVADAYLKGFLPIRAAVVTGNHDLEGEEFETDAANLAAWTKAGPVEQPCMLARLSSAMQIMQHEGQGDKLCSVSSMLSKSCEACRG